MIFYVAAHVVEQQSEIVETGLVELSELGGERLLPVAAGMEVKLEWAEPDAEPLAGGAALAREGRQRGQPGLGIGLVPAAAEEGIRLGRVKVEAEAARREETHRLAPVGPAPRLAEKALDQAELRSHGAGSSALIAAWTAVSMSRRFIPDGSSSPKRIVTMPGRLAKRCRGHRRPLSSATGTTGRPSAR